MPRHVAGIVLTKNECRVYTVRHCLIHGAVASVLTPRSRGTVVPWLGLASGVSMPRPRLGLEL